MIGFPVKSKFSNFSNDFYSVHYTNVRAYETLQVGELFDEVIGELESAQLFIFG